MSVDLGEIFDLVGDMLAAAIPTSGTQITLSRNPGGPNASTVNRTNLQVTDPTPEVEVATGVPCLIAPAAADAQRQAGPNLLLPGSEYIVVVLPDVDDVRPKDLGTVTAAIAPFLVGLRLRVEAVKDGSHGACRILACTVA